ncbi:MAG: D-alanine--D-alanine ligase [Oscillospiraceae bacterium]|nr:D-alanine--D-alanine ligase [Oscillospiraceae bacterium]
MKICVLAGGLCPERDVSLSSGCMIANALLSRGHHAALLDLYCGAPDADDFDGFYKKYGKASYEFKVPEHEPDLDAVRRENGGRAGLVGPNVTEICRTADAVFLALHGSAGEDGRLQAMFDMYGVTYTGTGYTGSLLAMDKLVSKELMRFAGILTPDWAVVPADSAAVPESVGLPCVMKPVGCGSSVGVSIIETADQWGAALEYAKKYEDAVFAEKKIAGREFSVGVLAGEALPAIEIIPKYGGFYDYKNKYQPGLMTEVCPADISGELEAQLAGCALAVHGALRLGSYSRIDFILGEDGLIYCLEANTLPGMTPTSLLPQEAAAAGIDFGELCERVVREAAFGRI